MKVIIAGSRDIEDYSMVVQAIIDSDFQIDEVVSGCARGVDKLGEAWAKVNAVPVKPFSADWKRYGKAAGMIRNKQMAEYADALIALPAPDSKGTRDMIKQATKLKLKIFVKEQK